MWASPCRRSAERGASKTALPTYDWLVTSPRPISPVSVRMRTTRASCVPSAISSTSGRRRWMASTSVIFMAGASAMGSSALARRSVQVEPGPDLESPELANELDEGRDDGLEPELPLLRGRQGRVADRPRLRDPRPPLDQPDGRAAGQVVPGVLRLVEADLIISLLHMYHLP